MVEKLPEDQYFVDILQKFKHSFNLLGELKHIIHNPNAPELIHYLLSPLQFILFTLRTKHSHQLQLAQEIWTPALTREARDLLLNCLTSKEHEILRNLGQAWIRAAYVQGSLLARRCLYDWLSCLGTIRYRSSPTIGQYFSKVGRFGFKKRPTNTRNPCHCKQYAPMTE